MLAPEQQRAVDYLARKGSRAAVAILREQMRSAFATIEKDFDAVPVEVRDRAPAPGKWSPREILDHLVLSHGPAISDLERLLGGVSVEGVAIPAGLHRPDAERPEWTPLRAQLGDIHRQLLALVDGASDDRSLEPKAKIEMVIKVDSEQRHWYEWVDWKALVQAIRVHTLEHQQQLARSV